ncbi:hypothetical protein SNEBB_011010 [Seison nebaliae]|nr:hypothetical protein SNEBB_011010 [Seison nebaliae]
MSKVEEVKEKIDEPAASRKHQETSSQQTVEEEERQKRKLRMITYCINLFHFVIFFLISFIITNKLSNGLYDHLSSDQISSISHLFEKLSDKLTSNDIPLPPTSSKTVSENDEIRSNPSTLHDIRIDESAQLMLDEERELLATKAKLMVEHAFNGYMKHAYPADELQPLSCNGRYRNLRQNRGDIDEILGNFSLTLIDSLDTLCLLGMYDELAYAIDQVKNSIRFDSNFIVSVFETNIRIVGGLLGGHSCVKKLQEMNIPQFRHYQQELLEKAIDIAERLLPAFHTKSGLPAPRINLKSGINFHQQYKDNFTCTACAGSILLEFGTLSHLTGDERYMNVAMKALDFLWASRHRSTNLPGTTLHIHHGKWEQRESSIGAGIDSYYEYLFKGYVIFNDEELLNRFIIHYRSIGQYLFAQPNNFPLPVQMHQPHQWTRRFLDSLSAFWPGLQASNGDITAAVILHERLMQVARRHHFLPEAFTEDLVAHWSYHLLRPELVESTYILHEITKDPYYLRVGKRLMESIEKFTKTSCGYAAIKNLHTGELENRMDSFVIAETFKYFYLLFKPTHLFPLDNFIFSTEAHLLPLLGPLPRRNQKSEKRQMLRRKEEELTCKKIDKFTSYQFTRLKDIRFRVRQTTNNEKVKSHFLQTQKKETSKQSFSWMTMKIFDVSNKSHIETLNKMGIRLSVEGNGKLLFKFYENNAISSMAAIEGGRFLNEIISNTHQFSEQQRLELNDYRVIQLMGNGEEDFLGMVARFGESFNGTLTSVVGEIVVIDWNLELCQLSIEEDEEGIKLINKIKSIKNKIFVIERGGCTFAKKVLIAQRLGAKAVIILDNEIFTSYTTSPHFQLLGDSEMTLTDELHIPVTLLMAKESLDFIHSLEEETIIRFSSFRLTREMMNRFKSHHYLDYFIYENRLTYHSLYQIFFIRSLISQQQLSYSQFFQCPIDLLSYQYLQQQEQQQQQQLKLKEISMDYSIHELFQISNETIKRISINKKFENETNRFIFNKLTIITSQKQQQQQQQQQEREIIYLYNFISLIHSISDEMKSLREILKIANFSNSIWYNFYIVNLTMKKEKNQNYVMEKLERSVKEVADIFACNFIRFIRLSRFDFNRSMGKEEYETECEWDTRWMVGRATKFAFVNYFRSILLQYFNAITSFYHFPSLNESEILMSEMFDSEKISYDVTSRHFRQLLRINARPLTVY